MDEPKSTGDASLAPESLTPEWFRRKLVSLIDSASTAAEPDFSAAATLMKLAAEHLPKSKRSDDFDPNEMVRQQLEREGHRS